MILYLYKINIISKKLINKKYKDNDWQKTIKFMLVTFVQYIK